MYIDLDPCGGTDPLGMFPVFVKKTDDIMAPRLSVVFRLLVRLDSACRIHSKVYWRLGRMQGSYRLISAQPLIGSTNREFSIRSVLYKVNQQEFGRSVLSILTQFLSNRSQHVMANGYRSKLVNGVSGVPHAGKCFGLVIVPPVHFGAFYQSGKSADQLC